MQQNYDFPLVNNSLIDLGEIINIKLFENSLLIVWCSYFVLSTDHMSLRPLAGLPMSDSGL